MAQTQQLDTFDKFQLFFDKHQRTIIIVATAVLLVVAGLFYFRNFYLPKQEEKAQVALFNAQNAFEQDSFQVALNGAGEKLGFLQVIKDYNYTKAANLAHAYAGISYLRLKDYDKAIEHLQDFDGENTVIGAVAIGALGDAYSQKNQMDKAIESYKKAATYKGDAFSAPIFLLKAALALEVQGKYKEAQEQLETLKENYPDFEKEMGTVDKHLARVSQLAK
ncbi:MAG: tetratricopeptide repeat protein [Chitinophagales bacterium]|nr:tetratricopeptide repeat protein [Chitinophagales bacterium]